MTYVIINKETGKLYKVTKYKINPSTNEITILEKKEVKMEAKYLYHIKHKKTKEEATCVLTGQNVVKAYLGSFTECDEQKAEWKVLRAYNITQNHIDFNKVIIVDDEYIKAINAKLKGVK